MKEEIFRKKSMDKVKSPENLDDFIRVSNPGVWLLLVSVIVLLIGACVWGIFGHVDSTVAVRVFAQDGDVICYDAETDAASVKEGMTVRFDKYEAVIADAGNDENIGFYFILESKETIPDGIYDGKIVISTVKPLSFILN